MQNFTYQNITKVIFGRGTVPQIGPEAKQYGSRALLVYGKGSIKKNGIYDQAVASLKKAGVEWVELSGVKANPVLSHTREGIALVKKEAVDVIVAVGGGSVIDEAKAIAAGAVVEHDVWDFYCGKAKIEKALPLVTVLTLAATGTEMNGGTVITNEETLEKFGMISAPLQPKASILDPTTNFSVPADYTALAGIDAISHLIEGYFNHTDPHTPIQDSYVEGLVRNIMNAVERVLAELKNYDARADMMWAATLAWNGLAMAGIGPAPFPNHMMGHSISALFDVAHGASLSVVTHPWMRYAARNGSPARLAKFTENVFGIRKGSAVETALAGADAFQAWCRKIGAPTTLSEVGITEPDQLEALVANTAHCAPLWGMPQFTPQVIAAILDNCR